MRRALLTLLALVGVGCALVVTASSTMAQAVIAGMSGLVPAALVGLLEVVNVAGTWTWITDPRPRVRLEAALGVAAASTVTAVCGALTYGPLGLVAPLGLLAAVHLVSRMWSVPATPAASELEVGGNGPSVVGGDAAVVGRAGAAVLAAAEPVRADVEPAAPNFDQPRLRPVDWTAVADAEATIAEGRAGPTADRAA